MLKKILLLAALTAVMATNAATARDQIRVVGSSTVFPFATAVAERFGKTSSFKTPVVESTGSGGGLKLFCAGLGAEHPDITNASRRIKQSEVARCAKNGVGDIVEVKIGYDGIVLANSRAAGPMSINLKQLFLALAKQVPVDGELVANPYKTWHDIDASLPMSKIEVLGPPPTSGTRDAFVEVAMESGAKTFPMLKALRKTDKKHFKAVAHTLREDGAFIEAGENDNLIVQKLETNPAAFGIFGFSFLDQNVDKLQGSRVNGMAPAFEAIAAGKYPISRSLYFYVKKAHVGTIPGLHDYVAEFTSEKSWGPDGYLADKGLIPLQDADRAKVRAQAAVLANLSM
ncbi:MAG: PstS family phosphate ABC transporter substrate-binding protein [Alphaproteobacteria bacterium]|nr:PstS family phosphate ABC transporter substrate-binding protein [Alphaproteobacteria bacterium]